MSNRCAGLAFIAVCFLSTSGASEPLATLSINPPSANVTPSQLITLQVDASTAEDIVFIQFTVEYDSTIATFTGNATRHPSMPPGFAVTNLAENFVPIQSSQANASVTVQLHGNGITDMFSGNQAVALLQFNVTPDACGASSLTFSSICGGTHLTTFDLVDICNPTLVGGSLQTGCTVDNAPSGSASRLTVWPSEPNPFNPSTTIRFEIPKPGMVMLRIFDGQGRAVRTLTASAYLAGPHRLTWNGTDDAGQNLPSGVYFYQVQALGETRTHRMLMLK